MFRMWLASAVAFTAVAVLAPHAAALTITPAAISFSPVTLNGAVQTVAGSTNSWRADAAAESGGWNVTVSATDFVNGDFKTIPVSNFEIRLLDANIVMVSGDPNGPSSTRTSLGALSGTPLKIASTAAGEGDGVYDLGPDFQLTVPAETYAGSYSSTVTVDVNAGP